MTSTHSALPAFICPPIVDISEFPRLCHLFSLKGKIPFKDSRLDRIFAHSTVEDAITEMCFSKTTGDLEDIFPDVPTADLVEMFKFLVASPFLSTIGTTDPDTIKRLAEHALARHSMCFYPWEMVHTAIKMRDCYDFEPLCLTRFCWYSLDWVLHLPVVYDIFKYMGTLENKFNPNLFIIGICDFLDDMSGSRAQCAVLFVHLIGNKKFLSHHVAESEFDGFKKAMLFQLLHWLSCNSAPYHGFETLLRNDRAKLMNEAKKCRRISREENVVKYSSVLIKGCYGNASLKPLLSLPTRMLHAYENNESVFRVRNLQIQNYHSAVAAHLGEDCVYAGDAMFDAMYTISGERHDDAIPLDVVCTRKAAINITECLDFDRWTTTHVRKSHGSFHLPGELCIRISDKWHKECDVLLHVVPTLTVYESLYQSDMGAVQVAFDGEQIRYSMRALSVVMSGVDVLCSHETTRAKRFDHALSVLTFVAPPAPVVEPTEIEKAKESELDELVQSKRDLMILLSTMSAETIYGLIIPSLAPPPLVRATKAIRAALQRDYATSDEYPVYVNPKREKIDNDE